MDWKDVVRGVAPAIGSALLGPAGGAAVKFLGDKLLDKPDASEAEVAAAITDMSSDERLQLRQLEADFATEMRKLGLDAEKLRLEFERVAAADRESARERQIRMGDRTPNRLAYIYTAGFFIVLLIQLILLFMPGVVVNPPILRLIDVSTGVLFAVVLASKDYFLGSSAGSARKTDMLKGADGR
jgi:hypothetical protein